MSQLIKRGTFDHPADSCTWEIEYDDGTQYGESNGASYAGIDRSKFKKFKLMSPDGAILFETWPPDGASGQNFIFRRRNFIDNGERNKVIFVFGYMPMGPAFAVDVKSGQWRMEDTFIEGDSELYAPQLMPGEHE